MTFYEISGCVFAALTLLLGLRFARTRSQGFGLTGALSFFCLSMTLYCFTAPFLQGNYELWGLLGTEGIILLLVILLPRFRSAEMDAEGKPLPLFSFAVPSWRHTLGGMLLLIGGANAASTASQLLYQLFPKAEQQVMSMNAHLSGFNLPLTLCATVLAPAVCEELLHRGVILGAMRGRYNDTFIVLVGGLIFGVFHMDPARLLATAVMGMVLTYAGLRSGTVLLPILMHAANNLYSLFIMNLIGDRLEELPLVAETPPQEGIWVILYSIAIALLFLHWGWRWLRDPKDRGLRSPMVPIGIAMALAAAAYIVAALVRWGA